MSNWIFSEVIVVDLEATCWETKEEESSNTSEVIEIGVCSLNVLTGEIGNPKCIIVKPRLSRVSPFCEGLTSITQGMVDDGIGFDAAINILRKEYAIGRKILAAYGNYDKNMLIKECERNGIKPMFGPTYVNISALASLKFKTGKRLGLQKACSLAGLEFEGRLHRGVDDAVMAAKVLWAIIK